MLVPRRASGVLLESKLLFKHAYADNFGLTHKERRRFSVSSA